MKKIKGLVMIMVVSLLLSGCVNSKAEKMSIQTAKLTKEETNILELFNDNEDYYIYDFNVDDTVKSMCISTYQLIDGKWEPLEIQYRQALEDQQGRLGLEFEYLSDGLNIAIQSEKNSGSSFYTKEIENDLDENSCATSVLEDETVIVYEKEIPLAIQIVTSKDQVKSYTVDYFFKPEVYQAENDEQVYAVTVSFSQKTLN